MKTKILDTQNEIELPKVFETPIREDIIKKVADTLFHKQPYAPYILAGKGSSQHKQSHCRRKFKTLYGKGISRVSRKALWRRGDQFYWVGTFSPGTVKGRAPHPPKTLRTPRFINKKEKILALKSCIAATASKTLLKKNYQNLPEINLPLIISSQLLDKKAKEIFSVLEKTKLNLKPEKKVRPGIGKVRGRKYKNTKKILLVLGKKEKFQKIKNLNLIFTNTNQLNVKDFSLNGKPGKLAIYTETAIKELGERFK
jgi:large subunit ribosomal protein L4e